MEHVEALGADECAPPSDSSSGDQSEFRKGWRVLVASVMGLMFSGSTMHTMTLGVLTPEFARVFGWTRTETQGSLGGHLARRMLDPWPRRRGHPSRPVLGARLSCGLPHPGGRWPPDAGFP